MNCTRCTELNYKKIHHIGIRKSKYARALSTLSFQLTTKFTKSAMIASFRNLWWSLILSIPLWWLFTKVKSQVISKTSASKRNESLNLKIRSIFTGMKMKLGRCSSIWGNYSGTLNSSFAKIQSLSITVFAAVCTKITNSLSRALRKFSALMSHGTTLKTRWPTLLISLDFYILSRMFLIRWIYSVRFLRPWRAGNTSSKVWSVSGVHTTFAILEILKLNQGQTAGTCLMIQLCKKLAPGMMFW